MKKKVIVISLGGSLIIPEDINTKFLSEFKKVILKNKKNYKFVIICGGGSTARKYILGLRSFGLNKKLQSFLGISATRMNARFMSYFFNRDMEKGIAHKMRTLKKYLKHDDVVFCGALEYKPKQTSDSTSAEIAKYFKSELINLTNVKGLYSKNPKKFKNAKFIPKISWKEFDKMASKLGFKPGQHFVLDQTASKIIMNHGIKTYILGQNPKQLDNMLGGKSLLGLLLRGEEMNRRRGELFNKSAYFKTVERIISGEDPSEEDFEYTLIESLKKRYREFYPLFCETVMFYYTREKRTPFQAVLASVKIIDKELGLHRK